MSAAVASSAPVDMQRKKDLARIHVLKKECGLDDDQYRLLLARVTGVESAKELGPESRARLLHELERVRQSCRRGAPTPAADRRPMPAPMPDKRALLSKISAQCHAAGYPQHYADGISKQMFGIDCVRWCTPEDLRKVVAALAIDRRRKGGAKNGSDVGT